MSKFFAEYLTKKVFICRAYIYCDNIYFEISKNFKTFYTNLIKKIYKFWY